MTEDDRKRFSFILFFHIFFIFFIFFSFFSYFFQKTSQILTFIFRATEVDPMMPRTRWKLAIPFVSKVIFLFLSLFFSPFCSPLILSFFFLSFLSLFLSLQDVPSRSSEFAHPDVIISLTFLAYRYS